MISQKKNRGIGLYQMERDSEARNAIYNVLSDGQWHRIKELKERTRISPTTMYRKLKLLEENFLIERKEDVKKGKYAVLYKAIPELVTIIRMRKLTTDLSQTLEKLLAETKDPLLAVDSIHLFSQLGILTVLKILSLLKKEKRDIPWTLVEFLEESLIWNPYRSLTLNLVRISMKTTDDIDLPKLLSSQAERNKKNNAKKIEDITKKYLKTLLVEPVE